MIRAPTLWNADAQSPGVAGLERRHVRLGSQESSLDRVCMPEEYSAGLGERDRSRPAGSLDEAEPDDALEGGDLLRYRRLRSPGAPRPSRRSPRRRSP